MSLFVNNVAWSPDSFYSSYHFEAQFLYSDPGVLGGASWVPISSTETQTDPTFEPTGIYFTWPLSPYGNDNRYLFLSRTFYIRGIARISQYNQEYAGNFYSKYQHVLRSLTTALFSWSTGGTGVTITGAWLDDYTTYSSLCYFSYDPNRHYSH